MIAVDTQEPVSHRWMFESAATTVLEVAGTLWIPVETTVLSRGFAVAWEAGSQLVRRHRDADEVEVLPVRDVRDRFAALPLPPSSYTITEPPVAVLRARTVESATQTASILYETAQSALERERAAAAGSRRVPILNRLGILHARFGATARARANFEAALEIRNGYLPAYVNLANLALSEDNAEEALRYLEQAELLRPQSAAVLELLARAHFVAGSGGVARDYVRSLAEVAPERAAALAVILPTSGRVAATDGVAASGASAEGRASAAGDPAALLPPSVWLVE
jgi:tetratricopeptide (TPR) repeat protein